MPHQLTTPCNSLTAYVTLPSLRHGNMTAARQGKAHVEPVHLQGALEICANFNPGYEIKLHDDADIQVAHLSEGCNACSSSVYISLGWPINVHVPPLVHCPLPLPTSFDPSVHGQSPTPVGGGDHIAICHAG